LEREESFTEYVEKLIAVVEGRPGATLPRDDEEEIRKLVESASDDGAGDE
jgi:hypothetical protein